MTEGHFLKNFLIVITKVVHMKKKTLSIIFALFISCTLFVACGKEEIVEVVAPIESVETVEPIETITEEIEISVEESTETVAEIESVVAETVSEEETSSEEVATDNIEIIEELDQMMYAQKNCNARNGDGTNYDKVASIEKSAYVHVTGRTSNDWYRVEWEGVEEGVVYISGSLLGLNKPSSDSGNNNNSGTSNSGSTNNDGSGSNNNGGNSNSGGQYSQEEVNDIMDSIFGEGTGGFGGEYGGSWDY